MRDSPRGEGRRWLEQAQVDLKWVRHLAEQDAHYLVCFLAQQAAEKALKAVLYARGEELVLGHSVRQLCQHLAADESRFAVYVDEWAVLDSYYIPTRYPDGLPGDIPARVYNRRAADSAKGLAEAVLSAVEGWFEDMESADGEENASSGQEKPSAPKG